jgi:predicted PurR-regulated permease PerM
VVLVIAVTLASALAPVAEALEKKRIPRAVTVILVYALVVLLYAAIAAYVAPALWDQARQLYHQLPQLFTGAMTRFDELMAKVPNVQGVDVGVEEAKGVAMTLARKTLSTAAGIVGVFVNAILVIFLTAYFVVEADRIWPTLLRWLPPSKRPLVGSLIRPLGARMGGYVRGQLLVSLAVGSFLAAGLTLLSVPYALVLGLMAGLLNLVPFVGSMITSVFAIVVAANHSVTTGFLTLGLFAVEQWLESNFIVPHLLGREVDLHPLVVLFAILIGASLMGVIGALIAVPLTSASLYLAQELYVKPLNAESDAAAAQEAATTSRPTASESDKPS